MKKYFCFFSFLFFFCSCKSGGSGSAIGGSIQDIFPLKVGNHWLYNVTEYSSAGTVKSTYPYDVLIRSNKTYQGMPAFEFSQQGDTTGRLLIYYSGSFDLYTIQNSKSLNHALHYPMNSGETFILVDTMYPDGSIRKELLILQGNSESVTVTAGSFSCLHFDRISLNGNAAKPDTNSMMKQYYALGKGLIQENDYAYDNAKKQYQSVSLQLQSYDLK